jgi:hypothetical protein
MANWKPEHHVGPVSWLSWLRRKGKQDGTLPPLGRGDYVCPRELWDCGLDTKTGLKQHCLSGPSRRGHCGAGTCRPVPSWNGWIRRTSAAVAVVTGLTLAGMIVWGGGSPVLAPGALSGPHAQLLTSQFQTARCAACHPAADGWPTGGRAADPSLAAAASGEDLTGRCLVCHAPQHPEMLRRSPHDLPPETLEKIGQARSNGGLPTAASPMVAKWLGQGLPPDSLACSDCHREHQGADADIKRISDRRCQSCHQQTFAGFVDGHPEFGDYPPRRQRRLAFDHRQHLEHYFPPRGRAFDCRQCHLQDEVGGIGQVVRSLGFEASCGECHQAGLSSGLVDGLTILQLPSLRLHGETLPLEEGEWPEAASFADAPVAAPIAQLWLAVEQAADAMPTSVPERWSAPLAAWRLIRQTAQAGQSGAMSALEKRFPLPTSPAGRSPTARLLSGLPPDLFSQAFASWFLGTEIPRPSRSGRRPQRSYGEGSWWLDDGELSIRYLPQPHADPLLSAWIELAQSLIAGDDEHGREPDQIGSAAERLLHSAEAKQCLLCHRLPAGSALAASGGRADGDSAGWQALGAVAARQKAARFNHGPHLLLPATSDCTTCHQLRPGERSKTVTDATASEATELPEFISLTKAACTSCHRPAGSSQACTTCHTYHRESPPDWLPRLAETFEGILGRR